MATVVANLEGSSAETLPDTLQSNAVTPYVYRGKPGSDFDLTVSRVIALASLEPGVAPDDVALPTERVVSAALHFLIAASERLGDSFPRGAAALDETGGIRVFWRQPGRSVQLWVPADESRPASVYHRDDTVHATERTWSAGPLARWLEWFVGV